MRDPEPLSDEWIRYTVGRFGTDPEDIARAVAAAALRWAARNLILESEDEHRIWTVHGSADANERAIVFRTHADVILAKADEIERGDA